MATLLASDSTGEDWAEPRPTAGGEPTWSRAELLWTVVGILLLGAFLAFVVDDYPLRTLISTR